MHFYLDLLGGREPFYESIARIASLADKERGFSRNEPAVGGKNASKGQ